MALAVLAVTITRAVEVVVAPGVLGAGSTHLVALMAAAVHRLFALAMPRDTLEPKAQSVLSGPAQRVNSLQRTSDLNF